MGRLWGVMGLRGGVGVMGYVGLRRVRSVMLGHGGVRGAWGEEDSPENENSRPYRTRPDRTRRNTENGRAAALGRLAAQHGEALALALQCGQLQPYPSSVG
jgi:hypothetical protein